MHVSLTLVDAPIGGRMFEEMLDTVDWLRHHTHVERFGSQCLGKQT